MQQRLILETREEVMFFDTDCGGVVHNLAYLRMIETCRTRLAAEMGLDLKTMASRQEFPVLTRTEIDYRRPAVLGDKLVIRGELEQVGKVRFWCRFDMTRDGQDEVLVHARQALALVRMPKAQPMRLPKDWSHRWLTSAE